MSDRILYGYWRSSATYRVRIGLALKRLDYRHQAVDLRAGAQHAPGYLALAPQGLVPCLDDGGTVLTQSVAILEYLDETYPDPPFLPAAPSARARVRAACLAIACDIHPLNNLSVLRRLRDTQGASETETEDWARHWIGRGFAALEQIAADRGDTLFGGGVTLADILLVPQMYNARRSGVAVEAYPRLVRIDAALCGRPAFSAAHPDKVR